jgi:hypothetical protein
MSDMMTIWKQANFEDAQDHMALQELQATLPRKRNWKKALAVSITLAACAAPALAIAAVNGYFEDPPEPTAAPRVQAEYRMAVTPPTAKAVTTEPVVVKAPAPKKVARRPIRCHTEQLELYGSQVRVCGPPTTPQQPPSRTAADLARLTRP